VPAATKLLGSGGQRGLAGAGTRSGRPRSISPLIDALNLVARRAYVAGADSGRDLMKPAPGEISAAPPPPLPPPPARSLGDAGRTDGRPPRFLDAAAAKTSGIPLINFNQFMTSLDSIKDCVAGPLSSADTPPPTTTTT